MRKTNSLLKEVIFTPQISIYQHRSSNSTNHRQIRVEENHTTNSLLHSILNSQFKLTQTQKSTRITLQNYKIKFRISRVWKSWR